MFLCQQHINVAKFLEQIQKHPILVKSRDQFPPITESPNLSSSHEFPPNSSTKPIQIQIRIISNNHFEKRHIAFDYRKLVARPPLSLHPSSGNCGGWHCDQPANSLASTGKTMTNAFSLPPPPAYTCAKLRILVPRGLVVVREGTW